MVDVLALPLIDLSFFQIVLLLFLSLLLLLLSSQEELQVISGISAANFSEAIMAL